MRTDYLYYHYFNDKNKKKTINEVYLSIGNMYIITNLNTGKTYIKYNDMVLPSIVKFINYDEYERILIAHHCINS